MTPEAFKTAVQEAYKKAMANRNSWTEYTDQSYRVFDGITVFGRDAGIDLIQSVIGLIKREAVHAAECKRASLTLRLGKTGNAARAAMVETLGEMTDLPVTEGNGVVTIAWAKDEPSMY